MNENHVYVIQGGEDSQDPLSLLVIFCKSDLHLVALLWKMICNLEDPMSIRHPVVDSTCEREKKVSNT